MQKTGILLMVAMLLVPSLVFACAKPAPTPATPTSKPISTPKATLAPTPKTTPAPATKPVEFRLANLVADDHIYGQTITYFANAVSKRTDGGITIHSFPNETLVKGAETLDAVKKGFIDMGIVSGPVHPTQLGFLGDAVDLPFMGGMEDTQKIVEAMRPEMEMALKPHNQKLLWQVAVVFAPFIKKAVDPNNPDFTGIRMRAAGKGKLAAIQALGGTTVSMTVSEVPSAISMGVLDGLVTSWDFIVANQLMDKLRYAYIGNMFTSFGGIGVTINLDILNKLTPEWQAIMLDEAGKTQQFLYDSFQTSTMDFMKKFKLAPDTHVIELTTAQKAIWVKKMAPVYHTFVTTYGSKAEDWLKTIEKITGATLPR